MTAARTIVLLGHCGPDEYLLKRAVSRAVKGAHVVSVNDLASLETHNLSRSLLLINRVLGGDFADDRGVELIRRLKGSADGPVMMLVSNHDDAQQEAIEAGALPGFGKSQLYDEATTARLRQAASM